MDKAQKEKYNERSLHVFDAREWRPSNRPGSFGREGKKGRR
jgi:hypothetical protein